MKRRAVLISFGAGVGALAPLASFAQVPAKIWRIGFLSSESATTYARRMDALRTGLADFGYVEGKNLVIEARWGEGKEERLDELAADLVRIKVDVIVSHAGNPVLAAKRATTSIPIVIAATGDAVAIGLVASLARPGGNVTGSALFGPQLQAKRLEILKDALPRLTQVAVLLNPDEQMSPVVHHAMAPAAKTLKLALYRFDVRNPEQLDGAFAAMAKQRVGDAVRRVAGRAHPSRIFAARGEYGRHAQSERLHPRRLAGCTSEDPGTIFENPEGEMIMSALTVRLPNSVHETIKDLAKRDGISINQFIASAAAEKMASFLTLDHLKREAAKVSRKNFEKFLRKVPNVPPPGDGLK